MAKLAGKKNISLDDMSQEIDLKRYLGRDATLREKKLFAELAVEKVNERTLDGKTIHGGKFKKYSKEYAKKKGVSQGSVDLFLNGPMLDSIDADYDESDGNNKVFVFMNDEDEIKKGYNHHIGDTLPKRPWFGITTDEARELADKVKSNRRRVPSEDPQGESFTLADLREAIEKLGIR